MSNVYLINDTLNRYTHVCTIIIQAGCDTWATVIIYNIVVIHHSYVS